MHIIVTIITCLLISFLFTYLAKKLKISTAIGLIISGILIGFPLLRNVILEPNINFISILGNIGLIVLMFLAGIEVSWSMLYKEKRDSIFVASFSAIIPFLLGFIIFYFLGFSLLTSLTIGLCMSITAEATNARVLLELKKLKTKLGSLMMGAGILDDIFGICLFLIIGYFVVGGIVTNEFMIMILSFVAFFMGILVHKFIGRRTLLINYFEKISLWTLIPFFFISVGIHFSLESLTVNFFFLILIISIAIIGKFLGVLLTKPFTKLKFKQIYLIGWGMNSRGAVELVIAFMALKVGLLDKYIYSNLIVMALFTTLIFPFFIKGIIKKEPKIME